MIDILSYGMIAGAAILALFYGLPAWLVYRKSEPVRVIVNCRPPMLYDEQHIDRPAYLRREKEEKQTMEKKPDFEIDQRSPECVYIKMGDLIVYVDNSTGEQIVDIWREE